MVFSFRYPKEVKEKARYLRRKGYSHKQISEKLGNISSSSIERWTKNIKIEYTCEFCGNKYIPTGNNQKYCSKKCEIKIRCLKRHNRHLRNREKDIIYSRQWRQKHPNYGKKHKEKWRNKCYDLLGYKCVICGSSQKLCIHKKDGCDHCNNSNIPTNFNSEPTYEYLKNNKNDWCLLCRTCHVILHKIAKIPNFLEKGTLLLNHFLETKKQ